ncbi:DUF4351 domain-containing protein [Coleofasciculus sp.]|uniref:DUF4351 domain-containing protein n=1 Tax=Coleofasciculus sp. TaxID=3100458 RepID=UPI003A49169E
MGVATRPLRSGVGLKSAIAPELQTRLRQLPSGQLEALADAVLTFTDVTDLTSWLQDNTQ